MIIGTIMIGSGNRHNSTILSYPEAAADGLCGPLQEIPGLLVALILVVRDYFCDTKAKIPVVGMNFFTNPTLLLLQ